MTAMNLEPIKIQDLELNIFNQFDKRWFLLTCGDFETGKFNTMTISWGSLGTVWDRPFAQVFVRPTRFTFEFMNQYDSFTLSAFNKTYKSSLDLLGSKSGREGDKIADSGLTPEKSSEVKSPCFKEAELVIECRKMYWQDLDPSHFLFANIEHKYPRKDYHRVYFGEVLAVFGTKEFIHPV
jgi:flavin reductase (DIM6/NTAB) family NADH-FMN oxidoreductase RutF